MSVKFYPFSVTLWCADIALQSVKPPNKKKKKKKSRRPKQYCLQLSIYLYLYIYIYIYIYIPYNKFRKPVKGKNRELRLVFLTDINNLASFIGISGRILFLTTDYCSLTMRVFIEIRS